MFREEEHVDRLADDALHGLLTAREAARVEHHAAACARCGAALHAARQRLGLLRALPPVEPPAALVPATLGRIARHGARRPLLGGRAAWSTLTALAASALVLAGLQTYYAGLRPSSLDLVVLGQRELLTPSRASLRVRLTDRGRGAALSGVPVLVALLAPDGTSHELARATTDDQGGAAPRFEVPGLPAGPYQLRVVAGAGDDREEVLRPVRLKRSCRLLLSSDRPVYQPGQKVLLRSLALRRPDLRPVAGEPAVFTLTDPRGNVLFKHARATSPFGISSAECPLDPEILEGAYTVACTVGDTESKLAIEVRRYVLPKFQVRVELDRPHYAPGAEARVTVRAAYFFGKPVADARVRVTLRDSLPGGGEPTSVTARTDGRGVARLRVPLPRPFVARPDGSMRVGDPAVKLLTSVTDGAGQECSRLSDCLVTSRPIRIDAVAEAGALVRGQTNAVHFLVRQVHGAAVADARVEVRLRQAAGDMGEAVATVRTDERGAASWALTVEQMAALLDGGQARFWLAVVDAGGNRLAAQEVSLPVGRGAGDFLVRLDRPVYHAGQPLSITALGAGVEPVFIDLIRDGQTLLSDLVAMKDGKGGHVIDLPADVFGTLQLVAYRFDPAEGLPRRKLRVVQVLPPEGVRVSATLDRGEYRPRGRATLDVRLTDAAGKPTPGAVSLAAVDEAVFSVLPQRPGMEQAFYTLEQELLAPVYALYPAWLPSADPQSIGRDRALLARTSSTLDEGSATAPAGPAAQVSEAGPHTLAVRTLPIKEREVAALRHRRMDALFLGWAALALATALAGYVALWSCLSVRTVLMIHGLGAFLGLACLPLMLGALVEERGAKMALGEAPAGEAFPREGLDPGTPGGEKGGPRVRSLFPETLLWKPELITDDQGRLATLAVPLADSITTWRLSASAVTADGRLGATQVPVRVFQPFFVELDLPPALTRGDEVGLPVVVYNHSGKPQKVKLTLARPDRAWFALTGPAEQTVELAAGEVRATRFPIRVNRVGSHTLQVSAVGAAVEDAIERTVEVVPDGRRVETTQSGSLDRPAELTLRVPPGVVEGSVKALVKFYPSGFSQLVEGLDGVFRMPTGCFEQTSSATYPNVLALDYLRRNRLGVPAVEAKARQYIHLGYQRLVGFEVPGGGFDWYGRAPANLTLTAYGLMEFEDMARVHDVDPKLIERTRAWLLARREADGSWKVDPQGAHLAGGDGRAKLATTAYIAWAAHASGKSLDQGGRTLDFLRSHPAEKITDPHTLALVANALLALDPEGAAAAPYLDRLAAVATAAENGHLFWQKDRQSSTVFYGGGVSADVETTALASLALIGGKGHAEAVRRALAWVVAHKDPGGTWHSTQATVLALRALLAGARAAADPADRQADLAVGDHRERVRVQADVLRWVDVTKHLKAGETRLRLSERTKTALGYQVVLRYHVPGAKRSDDDAPLAITLTYDRNDLAVNETLKVKARVVNRQAKPAPMVLLDLPVPPGFTARTDDFDRLVKNQRIGRYQIRPRSVLVYLRGLEPDSPLELDYSLQARMVLKAAVPPARAYEYYQPEKRGESRPGQVTVRAK